MSEYEKAGWPHHHMLIGHSVGPWWHQQEPILRRNSEVKLEQGMVLALEPHVNHWHVQDMILVTDGAPLLLSAKFNTDEPFLWCDDRVTLHVQTTLTSKSKRAIFRVATITGSQSSHRLNHLMRDPCCGVAVAFC